MAGARLHSGVSNRCSKPFLRSACLPQSFISNPDTVGLFINGNHGADHELQLLHAVAGLIMNEFCHHRHFSVLTGPVVPIFAFARTSQTAKSDAMTVHQVAMFPHSHDKLKVRRRVSTPPGGWLRCWCPCPVGKEGSAGTRWGAAASHGKL